MQNKPKMKLVKICAFEYPKQLLADVKNTFFYKTPLVTASDYWLGIIIYTVEYYKTNTWKKVQVFSCEVYEIFKSTYFYTTPPVVASEQ